MADLSGVLGTWNLFAYINQAVYYNNDDSASAVTLNLCNKSNGYAQVSVAISSSATVPSDAEWFRFKDIVGPNDVFEQLGILVPSGKYLVVRSSTASVNAVVYGVRSGTPITSVGLVQNDGSTNDGSTEALAATSAAAIKALTGTTTDGVYWINIPTVGPIQLYCDMSTDGGGWMMLGYAGSTSAVGDTSHIMFNQIGNVATTRASNQPSFSRFDLAKLFAGASASSQVMWRRTTDSNVIMIHSMDEMWNRIPGGTLPGNRSLVGSGAGFPITTFKLSNSGPGGIVTKTNGRYESGPAYPGIAWNSTYDNNADSVGSFTTFLNRRSLIYWETNGPQTNNQWFHADPLQMGPSRGATFGTTKKDIEVYFKI